MSIETLLLTELLQCGTADIPCLVSAIEDNNLEISDVMDEAKEYTETPKLNDLLYACVNLRIREISEEHGLELEEGKHYSAFFNFMDSHVYCTDMEQDAIREDHPEKADEIIEAINNIVV